MSTFLWKDGRIGWPLFCAVVFVTVSLLVSDYVWRVVTLPFDTLLILVLAANALAAALLIGCWFLPRRRRNRPKAENS